MEEQAREDIDDPELRRRADLRYHGQSFELTVEADDLDAVEERFAEAHERRYGYRMEGEDIELVNARLVATVPVERPELSAEDAEGDAEAGKRKANFDGEWQEVPVLRRGGMGGGGEGRGPGDRRVRRGDLRRAPRLVGRGRRRGDAGAGARDEPRSRHPLRPRQRALGHRRGGRRAADPRRLLLQHQGAPRLLGRAVRRRGPDGRPGRAHPGPPRRDARGGGGGDRARARRRATSGSSTTPTAAARTCPTSRSSRRSTSTATSSATRSRARTTPTSAACAPARCRPTRATSGRRAS